MGDFRWEQSFQFALAQRRHENRMPPELEYVGELYIGAPVEVLTDIFDKADTVEGSRNGVVVGFEAGGWIRVAIGIREFWFIPEELKVIE